MRRRWVVREGSLAANAAKAVSCGRLRRGFLGGRVDLDGRLAGEARIRGGSGGRVVFSLPSAVGCAQRGLDDVVGGFGHCAMSAAGQASSRNKARSAGGPGRMAAAVREWIFFPWWPQSVCWTLAVEIRALQVPEGRRTSGVERPWYVSGWEWMREPVACLAREADGELGPQRMP